MRVVAVQHDDEAPLGRLRDAFAADGARVDLVRTGPCAPLLDAPLLDRTDVLVVLGAVESVLNAHDAPWYRAEQALLRAADDAGIAILAVCFGAQVLADTFGGAVYRLARPEVGWTTARTSEPAQVAPGPWLNFHTDAVIPPPGATVVATSDQCVQAYRFRRHLAVQFHPEADVATVERWCDWLRASLDAAGADGDALQALARANDGAIAARCNDLVTAFLAATQS